MRVIVIGGLARSLVNFRGPLLKALTERGHEVLACAPAADESIQSQLAQWGVEYRHVPMARASMNPLGDLATFRALFRLFRKEQPDVVLGYTIKPVIWGSLAARFARIPRRYAMITGLGYAFIDGGGRKQRVVQRVVSSLYRTALKGADAVFFQNPDDEREFRERGLIQRETTSILTNGSGVDLDAFPSRPLPSEPVFLLLARLIGDKGIREYREAARSIRRHYPDAKFLLAGGKDPNPAAISDEELRQWQTEGDIEYLGDLDDVRPALADCAVYVLPSYREGTPRTVLEAMSMGRAIITTDAPGCRETVEEGVNGYLVPVRDAAALADAMERFIDNPALVAEMGRQSRRLAEEKYDVHKVNATVIAGLGLDSGGVLSGYPDV